MAVAFRPDGREVCTACTNGILYFWDVEEGVQLSSIEGRRDIDGGRKKNDITTAQTSARSKYFTSVTYSADGSCVLAGSKSKSACIYSVASGTLIKKFELSHNRYNKTLSGLNLNKSLSSLFHMFCVFASAHIPYPHKSCPILHSLVAGHWRASLGRSAATCSWTVFQCPHPALGSTKRPMRCWMRRRTETCCLERVRVRPLMEPRTRRPKY
jgi:WD40 repeat protein